MGEADDDDVDVRLAARLAVPHEAAVGEGDFVAGAEHQRPQLRDLLALADRVGRDKGDARLAATEIGDRLEQPRRDIVERPAAAAQPGNGADLRPLRRRLELRTDKRRITHDVAALRRRQHRVPVERQRVAVDDVGRLLERDAWRSQTEHRIIGVVGEVVGHPHRYARDLGGKFADLDAVELVDVELTHHRAVEPGQHRLVGEQLAQNIEFERP